LCCRLTDDYRVLEGYVEFAKGIGERWLRRDKILIVPVTATLKLGKPYFQKRARKKKVVAALERKTA
jgi:hypothetical protein